MKRNWNLQASLSTLCSGIPNKSSKTSGSTRQKRGRSAIRIYSDILLNIHKTIFEQLKNWGQNECKPTNKRKLGKLMNVNKQAKLQVKIFTFHTLQFGHQTVSVTEIIAPLLRVAFRFQFCAYILI